MEDNKKLTLKERINKLKKFTEENKTKIKLGIFVTLVGAEAIVVYLVLKDYNHKLKVGSTLCDKLEALSFDPIIKTMDKVDEDIYTNLAYNLEEAIFSSDVTSYVNERTYELTDDISKVVKVTMETIKK